MIVRRWVVLLACGLATGCGSYLRIDRQPFTPEVAGRVKTVVIAEPLGDERYALWVKYTAAAAFGPIGGMVHASVMDKKAARMNAAIDPAKTRLGQQFRQKIAGDLAARGVTVRWTSVPSDLALKDLPERLTRENPADVNMFVWVSAGYIASSDVSPYVPSVIVHVKAVGKTADQLLYERYYAYGPSLRRYEECGVYLELDDKTPYAFDSIEAMEANPDLAREGLTHVVALIGERISADLKGESTTTACRDVDVREG